MPYTKLDAGIIFSTVWREPHTTVRVWIALLALKDRRGEVRAAMPGLADAARVTIPECEAALTTFRAPDPYSRTQDYDGRRIEDIEGGWFVLNHEKYRGLEDTDDRRRKAAIRAKRYRDRHAVTHDDASRGVTGVTVTQTSRQADTDTDTDTDNNKSLTTFAHAWEIYPRRFGGNNRVDAEKQWNARIKAGISPTEMSAGVKRYATFCDATGKTGTEFVKAAKTFFGRSRHWEEAYDLPPAKGALDFAAAARAVDKEEHAG